MNARPCWASTAERDYLREQEIEDRKQEAIAEARAEVCAELRAKLVRAFDGEELTFRSDLDPKKRIALKEIISDALGSTSDAPMRALIAWQMPGCDEVFCRGSFREAVIDFHLDNVADLFAKNRVALREREAMEP